MIAHTTNMIVDGDDFFVAMLTSGAVRVGMFSERSVDIPEGHKFFNISVSATTEEEAEIIFDRLVEDGLVCM